jgi:hypothetical protein
MQFNLFFAYNISNKTMSAEPEESLTIKQKPSVGDRVDATIRATAEAAERARSYAKESVGNFKSLRSEIKWPLVIILVIIVLIAIIMSIVVAQSDDSPAAIGFMSTMWILSIIIGVIYVKVLNSGDKSA